MKEIAYILFGWLLGLLSPAIINKIEANYSKKQFFKAVCSELHDLQYRVAITSFLLGQRYGVIDRDFLSWISPVVKNYKGNEPNDSVIKLIETMMELNDGQFDAFVQSMRAKPNYGLGLKTFSASFTYTNIALISNLSINIQARIHEFKNQLDILNQEIVSAKEYMRMTFDSSISDENHKRINNDLSSKYVFIQERCKQVIEKANAVISSKI